MSEHMRMQSPQNSPLELLAMAGLATYYSRLGQRRWGPCGLLLPLVADTAGEEASIVAPLTSGDTVVQDTALTRFLESPVLSSAPSDTPLSAGVLFPRRPRIQ